MASRKLKHYFQDHRIKVLSAQPIEALLRNSEAIGSIGKWTAELNEDTVVFKHRSAIKSQVLADFVVEWTKEQATSAPARAEYWTMYFDGSLTVEGVGTRVLLMFPTGNKRRYTL